MDDRRIVLVDELRGFAIICMVIYHLLFSLIFIYSIDLGSSTSQIMFALQPFGAGLFILIAGFSSCYSKSNIKRGFIVLTFGLVITILTFLFIPEQVIYFGILHFLGISILIYELIKNIFRNANPVVFTIILTIIFILTFNLQRGFLSLPLLGSITMPRELYTSVLLAPIGFPPDTFVSADYFPLFPWFVLFLIGTVLGNLTKQKSCPEFCYRKHLPVFSSIGRYSLIIYILHQPVIYALLWVMKQIYII